MQTDLVAQYKDRLLKERAILEKELADVGVRNPSNAGDWVPAKPPDESFGADRNDNADIIEEMQEKNAALNELEGRLNEVLRALEKIERADGTFGMCEVSGEEIESERLMANPAARTCIGHMDAAQ